MGNCDEALHGGWGVSGPVLCKKFKCWLVNIRQIALIVIFFKFQKHVNDKPGWGLCQDERNHRGVHMPALQGVGGLTNVQK